jgi:hypothetical protein
VTTAVWIGLGIFLFAVVAGTIWVGYQVVKSWKQLRGLPRLLGELEKLNRGVADIQTRLTNVERQVGDLQRQTDSLSVTLARARVLAGAAGEVRSVLDAARTFIPGK